MCVRAFWIADDSEVKVVQTIQLPISQPSDSHKEKAIRKRNTWLKQDRFFWETFNFPCVCLYVFDCTCTQRGDEDCKSKKETCFFFLLDVFAYGNLLINCLYFGLLSIVKLAKNTNNNLSSSEQICSVDRTTDTDWMNSLNAFIVSLTVPVCSSLGYKISMWACLIAR